MSVPLKEQVTSSTEHYRPRFSFHRCLLVQDKIMSGGDLDTFKRPWKLGLKEHNMVFFAPKPSYKKSHKNTLYSRLVSLTSEKKQTRINMIHFNNFVFYSSDPLKLIDGKGGDTWGLSIFVGVCSRNTTSLSLSWYQFGVNPRPTLSNTTYLFNTKPFIQIVIIIVLLVNWLSSLFYPQ